jgi:hypothetical protein
MANIQTTTVVEAIEISAKLSPNTIASSGMMRHSNTFVTRIQSQQIDKPIVDVYQFVWILQRDNKS